MVDEMLQTLYISSRQQRQLTWGGLSFTGSSRNSSRNFLNFQQKTFLDTRLKKKRRSR